MKAIYASALLLLLASCDSDETDIFALMGRESTESAQTRKTDDDDGKDSLPTEGTGTSIGIVMEDTDFEEEVMVVHLGQ